MERTLHIRPVASDDRSWTCGQYRGRKGGYNSQFPSKAPGRTTLKPEIEASEEAAFAMLDD